MIMAAIGPVADCIITEADGSRTNAEVHFQKRLDAEKAVENFHNVVADGKRLLQGLYGIYVNGKAMLLVCTSKANPPLPS